MTRQWINHSRQSVHSPVVEPEPQSLAALQAWHCHHISSPPKHAAAPCPSSGPAVHILPSRREKPVRLPHACLAGERSIYLMVCSK